MAEGSWPAWVPSPGWAVDRPGELGAVPEAPRWPLGGEGTPEAQRVS